MSDKAAKAEAAAEPEAPKVTELVPGVTAVGDTIRIDPDVFYPEVAKAIGAPEELDQFWVEAIYQCAKLEVHRLIGAAPFDVFDTRRQDPPKTLQIVVESRKDTWALRNFPEGRGVEAATQGREARRLYTEWRGFIPR